MAGTLKSLAMAVTCVMSMSAAGAAQSAREIFERARLLEAAGHDQAEIIRLYEQVTTASPADPALAAAARARIAALRPAMGQGGERRLFVSDSFLASDISADGRIVVGQNETLSIEMRNLVTNEARLLVEATPSLTPMFPVVSRDGQWVAYGTFAPGPSPRAVGLAVIGTAPGAQPRVLISASSGPTFVPAGWSTDGQAILVGHGTAANAPGGGQRPQSLDWVSVADGRVQTIKTFDLQPNPGGFALSPDSRWIAYSVAGESAASLTDTQIRVLASDGSADNAVVTLAGSNMQPKWSADGQHLYFIGDRSGQSLWAVRMEKGRAAGEPALVRRDTQRGIVGATTNGHLYFTRRVGGEATIFVVDVAATAEHLVQMFTGDRGVLSPDGTAVAFIRYIGAHDAARNRPQELTVRNLTTGIERGYPVPGIDRQSPIRWKTDSRSLTVYATANPDSQVAGAFQEVDLRSGTTRQLLPRDSSQHRRSNSAAQTPDGRTMYMAARRDGGAVSQIVAVDVATGAERTIVRFPVPGVPAVLLEGAGGELGPQLALSPDGKTLALLSMEAPQLSHLYFIDVDGAAHQKVTQPGSDRLTGPLVWLPGGEGVVGGVTDGSGAIGLRVFVDGRPPVPLTFDFDQALQAGRIPRTNPRNRGAVSFSADGRRMAFGAVPIVQNELMILENVQLPVK